MRKQTRKIFLAVLMALILSVVFIACGTKVDSVTIDSEDFTLILQVEASKQLSASVLPDGAKAEDKVVTWTSSDEAIAKVSADGLVTAVAQGTADITAAVKSGKEDTVKVTVQNPTPATDVSITGATTTTTSGTIATTTTTPENLDTDLKLGVHQLTLGFTPANANFGKEVTYAVAVAGVESAEDIAAIATVSATGLLTLKKLGAEVTITVTLASNAAKTDSFTTDPIEVKSIARVVMGIPGSPVTVGVGVEAYVMVKVSNAQNTGIKLSDFGGIDPTSGSAVKTSGTGNVSFTSSYVDEDNQEGTATNGNTVTPISVMGATYYAVTFTVDAESSDLLLTLTVGGLGVEVPVVVEAATEDTQNAIAAIGSVSSITSDSIIAATLVGDIYGKIKKAQALYAAATAVQKGIIDLAGNGAKLAAYIEAADALVTTITDARGYFIPGMTYAADTTYEFTIPEVVFNTANGKLLAINGIVDDANFGVITPYDNTSHATRSQNQLNWNNASTGYVAVIAGLLDKTAAALAASTITANSNDYSGDGNFTVATTATLTTRNFLSSVIAAAREFEGYDALFTEAAVRVNPSNNLNAWLVSAVDEDYATNKSIVVVARTAYDKLDARQRAIAAVVTAFAKLQQAEARVKQLDDIQSAYAAIAAVLEWNVSSDLSPTIYGLGKEAVAKYGALSADDKALVLNATGLAEQWAAIGAKTTVITAAQNSNNPLKGDFKANSRANGATYEVTLTTVVFVTAGDNANEIADITFTAERENTTVANETYVTRWMTAAANGSGKSGAQLTIEYFIGKTAAQVGTIYAAIPATNAANGLIATGYAMGELVNNLYTGVTETARNFLSSLEVACAIHRA
jgi:hypothetical protein